MLPQSDAIKTGWRCLCPKCRKSSIYKSSFSLDLKDSCEACGLDLRKNDSADGPAVFMIFILGTALVPLALIFEYTVFPPLWVHAVLWTATALFLTLVMLKPLKAYVIALQYKHRPKDWT